MREAIIGFDSAWTDNRRNPGAICALILDDNQQSVFHPPSLVTFDQAAEFVQRTSYGCDYAIIGIDQPTVVPNEQGMRPVERVAASLISKLKGGVQPGRRSGLGASMFGDGAPIWRFLDRIGATQDPMAARGAATGIFVMEVFPALALPAIIPAIWERGHGAKYNPKARLFRPSDWPLVCLGVAAHASAIGQLEISLCAKGLATVAAPKKGDQDRLDALICLLIGLGWRRLPTEEGLFLGDLDSGYIVTPKVADEDVRGPVQAVGSNIGHVRWFQIVQPRKFDAASQQRPGARQHPRAAGPQRLVDVGDDDVAAGRGCDASGHGSGRKRSAHVGVEGKTGDAETHVADQRDGGGTVVAGRGPVPLRRETSGGANLGGAVDDFRADDAQVAGRRQSEDPAMAEYGRKVPRPVVLDSEQVAMGQQQGQPARVTTQPKSGGEDRRRDPGFHQARDQPLVEGARTGVQSQGHNRALSSRPGQSHMHLARGCVGGRRACDPGRQQGRRGENGAAGDREATHGPALFHTGGENAKVPRMTTPGDFTELPDGFRLEFDPAPATDIRGRLGKEINDFHSRTVPHESRRFALLVREGNRELAAGLIGVISWQWLFIEAVWVGDALRGQGVGRTLMARAEAHAAAEGCNSAWLDTFQAREFYLTIGYEVFGVLDDYPPGQSRSFMRKKLQVSLNIR